jgi:hypothetical protein
MVLSRRRPRTVLGCLVACRGPVRLSGLGARWLPGAWWGGGFPGCGPVRRGGPGPRLGWPCRVLRGGAGPCRAAPGPVPEPASPGHHCCRVVTGRFGVVLPQGPQPVLGCPAGGVGRIDDDHLQPGVGGHLDQPVPELPGGDAGEQPPEVPAAPAAGGPAAGPFASLGAGVGEVEVRPLARRPGPRVQPPLSAPGGKVPPGQRPQVPAHRPQDSLIPRRGAQPGPYPRACWRGRHERRGNRAQRTSHQPDPRAARRATVYMFGKDIYS